MGWFRHGPPKIACLGLPYVRNRESRSHWRGRERDAKQQRWDHWDHWQGRGDHPRQGSRPSGQCWLDPIGHWLHHRTRLSPLPMSSAVADMHNHASTLPVQIAPAVPPPCLTSLCLYFQSSNFSYLETAVLSQLQLIPASLPPPHGLPLTLQWLDLPTHDCEATTSASSTREGCRAGP